MTLDEYEEEIDWIANEVVEPARSAALDLLSSHIESCAWHGWARGRARELACQAHGLIDRDQDLLRGLDALYGLDAAESDD